MTILTNMKLVDVGREDKEVYFVFEKIFWADIKCH